MGDKDRRTTINNAPVRSDSTAMSPLLQPTESPWIPSLFPVLMTDTNFKEYEGFVWGFTELNAPEEDTPLMPIYQSFEKRFDSYKLWKDFNFRQVFWLTNFGFYFSRDRIDSGYGMIICFYCGAAITLSEVYGNRKDNNICVCHHRHCSFINTLCQNEWVKHFQRKIKTTKELLEEAGEEFRKFQEKRIAESQRSTPGIRDWLSEKLESFLRSFFCGVSKRFCLDCNRVNQVIFHPCGDSVSCTNCAKKRKDCSYCKKPFTGISRVT